MYFTITVFFNHREQKPRDSSSPGTAEGWSAVSDTFFLTTAARTPQVGKNDALGGLFVFLLAGCCWDHEKLP